MSGYPVFDAPLGGDLPADDVEPAPPCFWETSWFQASDGDLEFAQWLLNRCTSTGEMMTLESVEAIRRLHVLFRMKERLQLEFVRSAERRQSTAERWSMEDIIGEVGDVINTLHWQQQQDQGGEPHPPITSVLEPALDGDVLDAATKLLLSRSTLDNEELLRRWMAVLTREDEDEPALKKTIGHHEQIAYRQVETYLIILHASAGVKSEIEASVANLSPDTWEEELQHLVAGLEINPAEEKRRRSVADELESVLRQENTLKQSDVELFGSSQSLYGSKDADLDLCIFPIGRASCVLPTGTTVSDSRADTALTLTLVKLQEMLMQVQSSVQSLSQAFNDAVYAADWSAMYTPHCSAMYADNAYKIEFFFTHVSMLQDALGAELSQRPQPSPPPTPTASRNSDQRHQHAFYQIQDVLRRTSNYEVLEVITRTRVPIIRFPSLCSEYEYECDLSIGNVIATCNTQLLRAYASFDTRARHLGVAVKHWAKKRGISDASMGFLSSYSYVLLSIYYLQVVHVLPNLQDPDLLEAAKVPSKYYNGVNIAFCDDADIARDFYQRRGLDTDASLQSLLVGFFSFFATHFNFSHCFVAVRSPSVPQLKRHWASCGHRSISIQDPLETTRDLGGVLKRHNQQKVIHEFRRAFGKLNSGESFTNACALPNSN